MKTDRIANAHKIRSRNLRVTEEFKNKTTTLYFAQIGQLSLYEVGTGNYTCRSLLNPRLATYFYLYMPGYFFTLNLTMPQFIQKRIIKGYTHLIFVMF